MPSPNVAQALQLLLPEYHQTGQRIVSMGERISRSVCMADTNTAQALTQGDFSWVLIDDHLSKAFPLAATLLTEVRLLPMLTAALSRTCQDSAP